MFFLLHRCRLRWCWHCAWEWERKGSRYIVSTPGRFGGHSERGDTGLGVSPFPSVLSLKLLSPPLPTHTFCVTQERQHQRWQRPTAELWSITPTALPMRWWEIAFDKMLWAERLAVLILLTLASPVANCLASLYEIDSICWSRELFRY